MEINSSRGFGLKLKDIMDANQLKKVEDLIKKPGIYSKSTRVKLDFIKPSRLKPKEVLEAELKKVSEDFEAILINEMIKVMRGTISKEKLYGGGLAEDIFQSMLDNEYAEVMAHSTNFGLAEKIYEEYSKYL